VTNQTRRLKVEDAFGTGRKFLTFGGIETYLIFQQKFALRSFAAFEVFANSDAYAELERNHLRPIAETAHQHGFGLVVDCLVYKATPDCIAELGYAPEDLARLNQVSVEHMAGFASKWRSETGNSAEEMPILLSGDLGPRGDGYGLGNDQALTVEAAQDYHRRQISALAKTDVDMLTALSMTSSSEAIGIVLAAKEFGLPIIVSPTVETDGTLPDHSKLGDFVQQVDAATDNYPVFFQVNCAHPLHLQETLSTAASVNAPWLSRFKGVRVLGQIQPALRPIG